MGLLDYFLFITLFLKSLNVCIEIYVNICACQREKINTSQPESFCESIKRAYIIVIKPQSFFFLVCRLHKHIFTLRTEGQIHAGLKSRVAGGNNYNDGTSWHKN